MKTVKSICLTLLILGTGFPSVQAQTEERQVKPTVEYSRIPRSYTIGGISVEGAKNYDDYMLIGLSGLTVGQKVNIPGEEITDAVKRFWRNGLFSNVSIEADSVVGDKVYAIGNPLGVELRGTLTDGIVSAINRDVDVDGVTMTLIQTNAALNNGNSGGPLINRYGQVIGINVMKMGMDRWSTASVEGLGFAIPIASSAYIVNDILRCGEVQGEPVLGISVDRTPAYLPDGQQAARVYTVDLNGPGDKAGLEVDDLIYEADGVRVETSNDLLRVRHRHAAGEEMILKVCRGGEYLTVSVTLEAKK